MADSVVYKTTKTADCPLFVVYAITPRSGRQKKMGLCSFDSATVPRIERFLLFSRFGQVIECLAGNDLCADLFIRGSGRLCGICLG